jgi:hypothetical protein
MALSGMTNAAALAEQVAFQDPPEPGGASGPSGNGGDGGLILYWFEQFGRELADLFGSGSGSDLPPNYYVFQHRLNRPHGGRHPLYTAFIGMAPGIVVGMGGVRLVSAGGAPSPNPPLVKTEYRQPASSNPSLLKEKISLAILCLVRLAGATKPLRFALEACATIGEVPAGPISAAGCSAIVVAVLGPPTAALVYLIIRNCIKQYTELG